MPEERKTYSREQWREERRQRQETYRKQRWEARHHRRQQSGHVIPGIIILLGGILLLLRQTGMQIPDWVFSWPMLLIAIGLCMGIAHNFRDISAFLLILIGAGFLLPRAFDISIHLEQFIWPGIVILIGLLILIRPKRKLRWDNYQIADGTNEIAGTQKGNAWEAAKEQWKESTGFSGTSASDRIDTTAIFCGVKRTVLSKNFKGGDAVNVFGGTEINLTQADIEGMAVLDVVVVFGGLKLTVPPNWEVRNNVITLFAGVEEKRNAQVQGVSPDKVLLITGTAIFGGIDIRNY